MALVRKVSLWCNNWLGIAPIERWPTFVNTEAQGDTLRVTDCISRMRNSELLNRFLGSQLAARAIFILLAMSVHEDRVGWGCVSVHFVGGFLVECSHLARRIPSMVSVCSRHNLANETQKHVLYTCSFSWRVWRELDTMSCLAWGM